MVRFDLPSLSSQVFVLAARIQPVQDFTSKERKFTDDGKPLSRYTIGVFGDYGIDQMVVKAPEISGAADIMPGSPIRFVGLSGLLYQPNDGKNLSACSLSAEGVQIGEAAKGVKAP